MARTSSRPSGGSAANATVPATVVAVGSVSVGCRSSPKRWPKVNSTASSTTATRAATPRYRAGITTASERHRLCAALDLAAPVLPERVDRPTRQRVVRGEEPGQDRPVVVPAVVEQGEQTGDPLDDLAVQDQFAGHLL